MTLDESAQSKRIAAFDFLKIDVEGHEAEVLEVYAGLLTRRAIRQITFEVNETYLFRAGRRPSDLIELLRAHNFTLRILKETGQLEPCPDAPTGNWTTVVGLQQSPPEDR